MTIDVEISGRLAIADIRKLEAPLRSVVMALSIVKDVRIELVSFFPNVAVMRLHVSGSFSKEDGEALHDPIVTTVRRVPGFSSVETTMKEFHGNAAEWKRNGPRTSEMKPVPEDRG